MARARSCLRKLGVAKTGTMSSESPPPPAEDRATPVRPGLLYAALAVVAVAVMIPSLFGPFIFDDQPLIMGNHYVHSFEHWAKWFTGGLWDTNYDPTEGVVRRGYWRPVTLASYAWDWAVGGGSPLVFHATNLLVHAVNVVLLFVILRKWCRDDWGALAGAVLFAVHPVQTEPVAWIAGRTDSLCALGMLSAVLGLRTLAAGRRALGWPILVGGVAIAFGSKESAVTLPALVVVEYWAERARALTWREMGRLAFKSLPFVGLSLALLIGRRFAVVDVEEGQAITDLNHAQLVFEALGRYVQMLIWPADMTLGQANLYHDGPQTYRVDFRLGALGLGSLAALVVFILFTRLTRPRAALAALLTCGLIFPVSGVVWLGYAVLVSPRFLYVPMIGVAFGLGLFLPWLVTWLSVKAVAGGAATIGLVLSVVTFARASEFADEQTFWRAEIEHNPHYPAAQEYFIVRELRESRPRTALRLARHFFLSNLAAGFPEVYNRSHVTRIAEGVLQVTPDAKTDTLRKVQQFCSAMARGEAAVLDVPEVGIHFGLSDAPSLLAAIKTRRRLWLLLAAEAASRVGDDVATLSYVEQLLDGCETCWTILDSAAIARARAGDLDGALGVVRVAERVAPPGKMASLLNTLEGVRGAHAALDSGEGPLVSHYYASLGAFGRAFDAARTAVDNPPSDSPSRLALAELALRAGWVNDARRLVGSEMSDEGFRQWANELDPPLRWSDREPGPDVWLPDADAVGE